MRAEEVIAAGDILMIRRVYCQLRAEGVQAEGDPRVLAANLVYLYRIGVRDEKQLLALAPPCQLSTLRATVFSFPDSIAGMIALN